MERYKFSRFNYYYIRKNGLYILNTISGGLGKVKKEYEQYIIDNKDGYIDIDFFDEDTLKTFINARIIHLDGYSEIDFIKRMHFISRFKEGDSFGVTLVPTMGCNFRCPYCFENGRKNNNLMTEDTENKIIHYIRNEIKNRKVLSVSWFGGEPLVAISNVKRMQVKINNLVKELNLKLGSSMITNGYLLTQDLSKELYNLGITNMQITFDGAPQDHDKKRFTLSGKGSYEKIKSNILNADDRIKFSMRINVDKENLENLYPFIENLKTEGFLRKNISVYFAPVRDFEPYKQIEKDKYLTIEEYSFHEGELYKLLSKQGFYVGRSKVTPNFSNCGAIGDRSVLIEPTGFIHRCWNNVGREDIAIGHIDDDDIVNKQHYEIESSRWLSWNPFEDEICANCYLLPICMNGCPYFSLFKREGKYEYNCHTLKYNMEKILEAQIISNESSV